ncbi:hypothetical protein TCAL_12178 [Tigriopus californicus]|uniref:ETS domain-containing protein n=1 Tax=Tigriopus californicus TaxID=6832 RepID=A0A553PJX8_TIGCA|nr:hypothetical protein TCAL_12178 [Tigriopus californicus]
MLAHHSAPPLDRALRMTKVEDGGWPDTYAMLSSAGRGIISQGSGQIQLWQFLLELLADSANSGIIAWEGTNGEFKLTDPDENIMTKVHGKRYAYKFDFHALMQACSSQSTDAPNYKYQADLSGLLASPYPQASKLNGLFSQPNHFSSSFHQQSIFTPGTAYWNTNSVMSAGNIQNIYASNMDLAANKESQAQGPFVQPPTSSIHSSLPCTKFSDFKDFHSHLGKDLSPCIPTQIGSSASAVAAHRNASLNRYPYLSH